MKILVFTEGTILMPAYARDVNREERVKQSQAAGVQREERTLAYETNATLSPIKHGSVYDFKNYIPNGNAVLKLTGWTKQGAEILYLTSRRLKDEIQLISDVLREYNFPDYFRLYFRKQNEDYKDVAERLMPDILIEDDCESIGGEKEMVYPHIKLEIKQKIKSIIVRELAGIDSLPNRIIEL